MTTITYTVVARRNLGISATDTQTIWFAPYTHLRYNRTDADGSVRYTASIDRNFMEEEFLQRCQANHDILTWEKCL